MFQQPQRREVICCEKKTNMFKELKQMMSEGLEGAKEQVLNKSIINLDEF